MIEGIAKPKNAYGDIKDLLTSLEVFPKPDGMTFNLVVTQAECQCGWKGNKWNGVDTEPSVFEAREHIRTGSAYCKVFVRYNLSAA